MLDFNPSGFLLPLTKLSASSTAAVSDGFEKLCLIYSKGNDGQLASRRHVERGGGDSLARLDSSLRSNRKAKILQQELVADSGYASAEEDEDGFGEGDAEMEDVTEALQLVKHDPFELEFTIRWLTGFIARSSSWTSPSSGLLSDKELDEREALVEKAASLLSSCAGADVEEEALTRKFQFPLGPSSDEEDICVELNDMLAPEDHSSVGLQSWASSIYFARLMCQDPSGFDIVSDKPLRILELGAGTGMLSIAAAKIHSALCGEQVEAEIVATDYHPDVLANLQRNVDTNFPSTAHPSISIHLLDWQYPPLEMPFDKHFDVILAADVVYDASHAGWIKDCVERMLKRPSPACSEGGVFWMIIAIRNTGRHEGLAESVFDVFPVVSAEQETPSEHLSLKSVMVQDMERSGGVGRMDESGYRLFKICWM